ncbi:MAG: CheR family methyltransferase [Pseudomonadota bacterium]
MNTTERTNNQETLTDSNYQKVREWLREKSGVELGDKRHVLVQSRLNRRLKEISAKNINVYIDWLSNPENEKNPEWENFIDVLTTHETYFYREAQHFDFLRQMIVPEYRKKNFRVLSAACSSGEEVYTLAFELAESLGLNSNWTVKGVDISNDVIKTAKLGYYNESRARMVPENIRKKYLLKGVGEHQGFCKVKKNIQEKITFGTANILKPIKPSPFQLIFCRNILIYFDNETKRQLIKNLFNHLSEGGYLIVSQTEQLRDYVSANMLVSSSIARKC